MDKKQYDEALTEVCRALVGEMLDAYIAKLLADKENLINQMVSKMTPPMGDVLRGTYHSGGEYETPWHGKVHRMDLPKTDPLWDDYFELVSDLSSGKMLVKNTGQRVEFFKPTVTGHEPVTENQKLMCFAFLDIGVAEIVMIRHTTAYGDALEFKQVGKTLTQVDLYRRFRETVENMPVVGSPDHDQAKPPAEINVKPDLRTHPYAEIYSSLVHDLMADNVMIILRHVKGAASITVGYRLAAVSGIIDVTEEEATLLTLLRNKGLICVSRAMHQTEHGHCYSVTLSEPLCTRLEMLRRFPELVKELPQ